MPETGFVILTLKFRREDKLWLGACEELGTATDGRSLSKVHDELIELVALHLNTLEDVGERARFFRENKIKFYTDDETAPESVETRIPVGREEFYEVHRLAIPA